MIRAARSDPALREEWPVLRDLERIVDDPTTTPTQAAFLGAIVARMRGQWAQVEAICQPLTTPASGASHHEQAYAWFLIGAAADARHRWQQARTARHRARRLSTARHALCLAIGISDLEQAIRLRRGSDAVAIRRWLERAEHRAPPPASIQYRLDVAWLESCTLSNGTVNRGVTSRLQRAVASLLRDMPQPTPRIRTEWVRLLRIAVALEADDLARQILARCDHPTCPPDDRPALVVEIDILGGRVALAGGRLERALRRYATAAVGLAVLAADHPERNRLHRDLQRLEAAVHQASRHEAASVP